MKKLLFSLFIIFTLSLVLTGCSNEPDTDDGGGGGVVGYGDDDDDDDDDDGNTTSTCTGTVADGFGDKPPIFIQDLFLAGHQAWVPGTYTDPLATATMPTVRNAMLMFKSDSRLKVRFKINSQPLPPIGETYCYGRESGPGDEFAYTKLKFRLSLRDVKCDNPDPGDPYNCLSDFYLSDPYGSQFINAPVDVGSCSNTISLGPLRNQTQYATVVIVDDVKADSTCQANGTFCPAEKIVRTRSCWHMTMQISTDHTQDLQ